MSLATMAATPLTGTWSGDRATLTLTATGGSLIEDCLETTIDAVSVRRRDGALIATGYHDGDTPGPQRVEPGPPQVATRLTITKVGEGLIVSRGEGRSLEYLRLQPGRRVKHIRCL